MSLVHQSYKGHVKYFCFIKAYPSGELRDKQPTCLQPIQLILEKQKKMKEKYLAFCASLVFI